MDVSNRALLVNLHIYQWGARKFDKTITNYMSNWTNAQPENFSGYKRLVPKHSTQQLEKLVQRARREFQLWTTPWFDNGTRMLPANMYLKFVTRMNELLNDIENEKRNFLNNYSTYVEQAKTEGLGTLFRKDDYPTVEELDRKITYKVTFLPMPTEKDFRLHMAQEDADAIAYDLQEETREAQKRATEYLWDKLNQRVKAFHEGMTREPDGNGAGGYFKDALIDNMRSVTELVRGLNVLNNKDLDSCCADVEYKLCRYEASALREDEFLRQSMAKEAERILKQIKERAHATSYQDETSQVAHAAG